MHPRHRYTAYPFPELGRLPAEPLVPAKASAKSPLRTACSSCGRDRRTLAPGRREPQAAPLLEAACGGRRGERVCLTGRARDRQSGRRGSTVAGRLDQAVVAVTPRRPASLRSTNTAAAAAARGGPDRDQGDLPARHAASGDHADGAGRERRHRDCAPVPDRYRVGEGSRAGCQQAADDRDLHRGQPAQAWKGHSAGR